MFYFTSFSERGPAFLLVIALLIIWTLIWKGMALWKSARRGDKVWFIVLLIVNTVGLLEILYLYIFSKDKVDNSSTSPQSNPNQTQ